MASLSKSVSLKPSSNALLSSFDADQALGLVASANDLTLLIGTDGRIEDICSRLAETFDNWSGRYWIDTVSPESRPKVESMLSGNEGPREINQRADDGTDYPFSVSIMPIGQSGLRIALGRDMRHVASLQQQLITAQLEVEKEYSRLRQAEVRYRLLFQVAAEPMMIVDASSEQIVESNPSARALLGDTLGEKNGPKLPSLIAKDHATELRNALAQASSQGTTHSNPLMLADGNQEVRIGITVFREGEDFFYLLRFLSEDVSVLQSEPPLIQDLAIISRLPEAFVVVDKSHRVVSANRAFLDMTETSTDAQTVGTAIDMFVGRTGVDTNILLRNVREHGSIRNFRTVCRGALGGETEVAVTAVSAGLGDDVWYGMSLHEIRSAADRKPLNLVKPDEDKAAIDKFASLIGRVPLKELVRDSTDLIERRCIEAALKVTGGNRASAAEMLGLSRQSLYVKLRKFELVGDND